MLYAISEMPKVIAAGFTRLLSGHYSASFRVLLLLLILLLKEVVVVQPKHRCFTEPLQVVQAKGGPVQWIEFPISVVITKNCCFQILKGAHVKNVELGIAYPYAKQCWLKLFFLFCFDETTKYFRQQNW